MPKSTPHVTGLPDERQARAAAWAAAALGQEKVELLPVSGDASFRRYFRLACGRDSIILMDAPPELEDSAPFVDIAGRLRRAGLHAPRIIEFDHDRGFGLLEDLGDTLYRDLIDESSAGELFPPLFDVLACMAANVASKGLPEYGSVLLRQEMELFPRWYLQKHRKRPLSAAECKRWNRLTEALIRSAASQPRVFVHKDFHSCNLLYEASGQPGIIDFQDAVIGPISYDFISLVWDRYISWPRQQLECWMDDVKPLLRISCDAETWRRQCDWMGLQRNLKIVGIFARLHYRDHKPGYLEMIPRFYQYLVDVLSLYPEFHDVIQILEQPECVP